VLVSEQGEVKLTDFGIAKAMGRREHTGHGVIKGKLAFMSPEQASGTAVDGRSDLFSLGTVAVPAGTGPSPLRRPHRSRGLVRVRQCQFAPPAQVAPDISPEFARITLRAMQAAPANRYQAQRRCWSTSRPCSVLPSSPRARPSSSAGWRICSG